LHHRCLHQVRCGHKDAETVADAIYRDCFSKFGIPAQIHTDRGKKFVNKLSEELFQLLNVRHTKTSLAHPQCNAQVEVFNKTVKKFLQSFMDDTTLNWETFLLALAATQVITQQLNYFLGNKPGYHHFLMKTFRK
jgi:transposase InsO family protein